MRAGPVTLFLCGDVMLGRGVDQILPCPGDPALREAYISDARSYVELAEAVNGRIPRPVGFSWPWGDALWVLDEATLDVRVVNLETSVTRSDEFAPGKGVHYRMNPGNLPCLAEVRPDVCALANNHVLDFGRPGLGETLDVLAGAGLRTAGAGRDADEARRPAIVPDGHGGRVLVFSFGLPSSGIPTDWAATRHRAGVDVVPEPSTAAAAAIADRVRREKRPGDVAVASVHWGSNWGYRIPLEQVRFAHRLVDGGVDVVHGHSSHHPRPIEVYHGRLILYGCGDLVDDYEGITGNERYRDDLRLLYLVSLEPGSGELAGLRMVPLQAHRMRLRHASQEDSHWLRGLLDRIGGGFGARVGLEPDGVLTLRRD
ncbi:poly-gamma-glutamate synthesis protein (capsule biosynthesis protein) [Streptosporangium becharense]|uniref:Poly-gamma-glutamate synthesis protein (Capsule biosynthesis protein) n=1 Tax=Streptosporangium becharense TaxID=1816182 RepID=A0A7W9MIU2_9ACTN|nr:CapA family protein [Streptosporangium becharense]MBB2911064.1 poly-gamma-glutamate synthesis protein (capsule biosynthesis protein) [Streptosporangium becharense]MBB5821878.1 poly-gamma-glutamate synthesis protein (capsule biosynthesis protein) [Streptosporangium becharense]